MKYKIIVDKQSRTNPSSEKKEYLIDIEELRVKGEVYDSLVITKDEDYVMRRLSLSEYHVLTELETPKKEPLKDITIELFEGDNYIYLVDMVGNKFYAEYIVKNDFTDIYVTTNEMNSAINQTAQSIELSVNQKLTGYSTTNEMNSAINIKANEITSSVSKTYSTKEELATAKSEIKQTTDSITSTVSKKIGNDEVISKINQSAETVSISANKVDLSGYVTVSNLQTAGKTTINGSNITTGTIDASKATITNINADNIKSGTITGRSISGGTITGTKITNGNNFSVDKDGNLTCNNSTCNNINIKSGKIKLLGNGSLNVADSSGQQSAGIDPAQITLFNTFSNSIRIIAELGILIATTEGDTDITGGGITTPSVTQTSLEESKKNFEKLQNGLDIIKATEIYKYNLKSQTDGEKKHIGFVIGKNYKYSNEITALDNEGKEVGVDTYSMISVAYKAIQEQQEQIEQLQEKDKQKDEIITNLIERIETLEKEVNNANS